MIKVTCDVCDGSGVVDIEYFDQAVEEVTCANCGGLGEMYYPITITAPDNRYFASGSEPFETLVYRD